MFFNAFKRLKNIPDTPHIPADTMPNSHIKQHQPKLILFDLDHTLLPIDSDQAWGEFLYETGKVDDAYRVKNQQFYQDYTNGSLSIPDFLALSFSILAKFDRATLAQMQAEFITQKILPHIQPSALYLLKQHAAKDVCLLVTATNSFVTQGIADVLGFKPKHLVATEPATQDPQDAPWQETQALFSGAIRGVPCFKEHKVTRIEAALVALGYRRSDFSSVWAYSDSHNDIPMLTWADCAYATNPDAILKAHAKQHGWHQLYLF